jgi:CubicO group peptidase (beta-lactamase class C family)
MLLDVTKSEYSSFESKGSDHSMARFARGSQVPLVRETILWSDPLPVRKILALTLLLFLASAPNSLFGQTECAGPVDAIFQPWSKPGTPGAAVAVMQHGKLVYEKGYGLANLEYDIPVTPQTVFHVASVSKQFTAMALVLLEQDGKLSLEDDVHKYLPELPDYGHPITLRQLLQHCSGIRDQWQTLALAGWRLDDVITQKQILRLLFQQKELNFVPGTSHLYSNGGYTLAAEVVTRVSGTPFPAFCLERIFRPLGMTHTHFHDDHRRIVHDRAYSYESTLASYQASPLNYANAGATSLFTTASDLVRWLDNFREPKVGGRTAINRMQEQAVLADGKKIDYALGLSMGRFRGLKTLSHGGGDAGYRSFVLWFPDQELGIAVVSGLASFDSGGTANKVAEVFLGLQMVPVAAKPTPPASSSEPSSRGTTSEPGNLEEYQGTYWSDELETQYTVTLQRGKLTASHIRHGDIRLYPAGQDRFTTREWFMPEVHFLRDSANKVSGLTFGGGRVTAIRFNRKM